MSELNVVRIDFKGYMNKTVRFFNALMNVSGFSLLSSTLIGGGSNCERSSGPLNHHRICLCRK